MLSLLKYLLLPSGLNFQHSQANIYPKVVNRLMTNATHCILEAIENEIIRLDSDFRRKKSSGERNEGLKELERGTAEKSRL